ncbi:MAG: hypothetical protein D6744_16185, partial [Planctomycetota bacterium]
MAALVAPALAQTAGMQSFQGLIKDAGGVPIQGAVTLNFRIYDAASGGTLVSGPFGPTNVTAVNGVVSAKFGPVAAGAFGGAPRWLEVDANGVTLPRVEMATAPAAAEQLVVPGTGSAAMYVSPSGPMVNIPSLRNNEIHLKVDSMVNQVGVPAVLFQNTTHTDDQIVFRVRGDSDLDAGGPFDFEVAASGLVRVRVLQITGGADIAEPFDISSPTGDDAIQPGHVVAIDPKNP